MTPEQNRAGPGAEPSMNDMLLSVGRTLIPALLPLLSFFAAPIQQSPTIWFRTAWIGPSSPWASASRRHYHPGCFTILLTSPSPVPAIAARGRHVISTRPTRRLWTGCGSRQADVPRRFLNKLWPAPEDQRAVLLLRRGRRPLLRGGPRRCSIFIGT